MIGHPFQMFCFDFQKINCIALSYIFSCKSFKLQFEIVMISCVNVKIKVIIVYNVSFIVLILVTTTDGESQHQKSFWRVFGL